MCVRVRACVRVCVQLCVRGGVQICTSVLVQLMSCSPNEVYETLSLTRYHIIVDM